MTNINKEIAMDMLHNLTENKMAQLIKALDINLCLTSTRTLSDVEMRVYKEGFYLELSGARCGINIWCTDNDGELIEGRKPHESKLNLLYRDNLRFFESDFDKF